MPRLVLLGLGEPDLDVLSRISRLDPRPEVLVVHPDPEALILRLAGVAQYPALTEPPRPRPDDVVLVPEGNVASVAELAAPFRAVGARILVPTSLRAGMRSLDELLQPAVAVRRVGNGGAAPLAMAEPSNEPEPKPVTSGESGSSPIVNASPEPAPAPAPGRPGGGGPGAGGGPPTDVWERPEASFRYLIESSVGSGRRVILWWNGMTDVWVPWVWTGAAPPAHAEGGPEEGIEIASQWGRFRLSGVSGERDRLNLAGLTRVAEDMALRDLVRWRREAHALAAHGLPDPHAEGPGLASWSEPVLELLGVESALFWRREGAGWKLVEARGEGIGFSGNLVFPKDLFSATFEGADSPWRRWEPTPGVRLLLAGADETDPHWPLRLRRVELALAGEEPGW